MATSGQCPICLNYFEGLHEHHVILREVTLNGIKGIDGPTVYLCGSCHDFLHRTASSLLSKKKSKSYFTDAQLQRASPYLKILVAAMQVKREEKSAGQKSTVVLHFTWEQMERIHAAKTDNGYTNLQDFLEALVIKSV